MNEFQVVALAGGVGGAKLADGLAQVLPQGMLTVIVNTGDDFIHIGLRISPDLDTVCYNLAGIANPEIGWGRDNETWHVFDSLTKMGMPDWFRLGDADLATHIIRNARYHEGKMLSMITAEFCQKWGIKSRVLPMTDDIVQTWVYTHEGDMGFQEYFVHRLCKPVVKGFRFEGAEKSRPAPGVLEAINECDIVVICPSNPWVSIDPILAVPGIKEAICEQPVLAVSPIIGGKALKGPAAKMFTEMGIQPSATAVAKHYQGIIQWMVIDTSDNLEKSDINHMGIEPIVSDIVMRDRADRGRLARELLKSISMGGKGE